MKILHFLTSINTGGAEKFCVDLCNTQASLADTEIYLCVLDKLKDNQPLVKQISSNIKLISLDKTDSYSLKIIYKIYKLLNKINPDIIHLNGRALIYTSIPIILKRIPSIYTVHTLAHKEYNKYFQLYNKFLFTKISKLFSPVAIGATVLKSIQKVYGKQFNQVIYNGTSNLKISSQFQEVLTYITNLKNNDDTLIFTYIGRITPEKNTLLLIDTFNELLNNNENVALCIIGYDSTPEKKYIQECKQNNKYPHKIQFLGRKENIADYLYFSDATCLTSIYEGLPLVPLESFSMGIPVLSTPAGGVIDIIIGGMNGYVSEATNVSSYLEILKSFILKPLKNKDQIKNIYYAKYTMEICAKNYIKIYKKKVIQEKDENVFSS